MAKYQNNILSAWCAILLVFNNIVQSQNEINVHHYNIFYPVSFDCSNLTNTSSGCIVIGSGVRLRCLNANGKLVDGDIGPVNSISGNLGEFFAFSRHSVDGIGRITFNFLPVTPVSRAVIYFFNSPNDSIGLPMISLYGVSSQPLSYYFDNNDDLRQSDSQLRNVTLYIQELTDVVQLDFIFNTSVIDWLLISEVKFYNDTLMYPLLDTIDFQNDSLLTMTLGADNLQSSINLSCTVVNAGSFEWQWQHNGNMLGLSDRLQILIGDATRTSILTISQLRYSDAGNYTCQAKHSLISVNATRKIEVHLTVSLKPLLSYIDDTIVSLSCELTGYLTTSSDIQWIRDNIILTNTSNKYVITNTLGRGKAINSSGMMTKSIVSELTISNLNQSDNGSYICNVPGTDLQQIIIVTINFSTILSISPSLLAPFTLSKISSEIVATSSLDQSSIPVSTISSHIIVTLTFDQSSSTPALSSDNISSINNIVIALSCVIVILLIALIIVSILACILGYCVLKWRQKTMQHTIEKVTTKFNVTDNSAYGIATYNEQGIVYEELDSIQHLHYDDPSTVI